VNYRFFPHFYCNSPFDQLQVDEAGEALLVISVETRVIMSSLVD
jgi:hypothetical protein